MKYVYPFIIVSLFLFSCENIDTILESGWNDFESEQYVSAIKKFNEAASKYEYDWNKGYSQKCQVLRYLYFTERISQGQFLTETKATYDLWYMNNPSDKKHLIPYAVLLFLLGDENQSYVIMEKAYNGNWNYNLRNPAIADICNFFAGISLGKLKREDYQNTVYEFLFDLTKDEMINIFVGS